MKEGSNMINFKVWIPAEVLLKTGMELDRLLYAEITDPDPSVDASIPQFVPWPFSRYTEAVNYVEASIELGQTDRQSFG
ncbi:hypothetical protein CS542_05840 [Pedobacter sp. IW39]|nr:hypothetical protein CS542_05840 [Pedobacter sp. IW39]